MPDVRNNRNFKGYFDKVMNNKEILLKITTFNLFTLISKDSSYERNF